MVGQAKLVVHARVTKVHADHSADVEVIELFKGAKPTVLVPLADPQAMCGTRLEVGEERVFFVYSRPLTSCGKVEPSPELLQALRRENK
jgi:hypothetical protein